MPKTVKEIVIVPLEEIFKKLESPFSQRKRGKFSQFTNASMDYIEDTCAKALESPEMQHVLKHETFDLIIVDILMNYCILGVIPALKSPSIFVSTLVAPSFLLQPLGNRMPPSFVPDPFLSYSDKMTFMERVSNLMFGLFVDVVGSLLFLPKLEKIYKDRLLVKEGIVEIGANVSILFVNSHFTLNYPRPYLPDVVDIGGLHTRPAQPLPKVIIASIP